LSARWFFARDGHTYGPLPAALLKELAAAGQLRPTDLVWGEGADKRVAAGKVRGLVFKGSPAAVGVKLGEKPAPPDDAEIPRAVRAADEPAPPGRAVPTLVRVYAIALMSLSVFNVVTCLPCAGYGLLADVLDWPWIGPQVPLVRALAVCFGAALAFGLWSQVLRGRWWAVAVVRVCYLLAAVGAVVSTVLAVALGSAANFIAPGFRELLVVQAVLGGVVVVLYLPFYISTSRHRKAFN
jgi:hypothetical protein